ncbi:hypothetical protein [Prevotella sp. 10(H)]|uniref:hypothetical protein n=1 Tax=Prevotella sp. 10(H) TaxID=1158294 RepID=UPI000B04F274|nr:hypothetical protein [Prevotella sp. 10(H)]
MRKILNNIRQLPFIVKGMVFALIVMYSFSSCCITGYCQVAEPENTQQEETNNNNIKN